MNDGLFSRIEAEKYLKDESSFMDVVNAAFIDKSIGFQRASALEEIGHAGARLAVSGGLAGFLNLLLSIIFYFLYVIFTGFQKLFIVRSFFYLIGLTFIILFPCCIYFLFYSTGTHITILLLSIVLLYIFYKSHSRKTFIITLISFFISVFLSLDIHYLNIIYTPEREYLGRWVSSSRYYVKIMKDKETGDKTITSNLLPRREGANYAHVFGYNYIHVFDKNDKNNTISFIHLNGKFFFEPFFGKHVILEKI